MSSLYLELSAIPPNADPAASVRQCVEIANETRIIVCADIADVTVWAFPEDDPDELVKAWQRQASRPWAINRTALVFQTFTAPAVRMR